MESELSKDEYKTPEEIAIDTITEMITQRGYKIIQTDEDKIIAENTDGENIVVFTNPVVKFSIDRIKEYISILHNINMNHCIVIYVDSITPATKKLVNDSIDVKIEVFRLEELQYNITKHKLVPKHQRLLPNRAKNFKKKYGLKFATILVTDPISRFYNYSKGDVIKISRKSDRGIYVTYRIVK